MTLPKLEALVERLRYAAKVDICASSARTSAEAADEITLLMEREKRLVAAVERARDQFAEYAELHKAKLHDGTPSAEWLGIQRKVERNRELADAMSASLTGGEEG